MNNEDRFLSAVIYLLTLSLTDIVPVISKVAIYKSLIFHMYDIVLIPLANLHSLTKLPQCLRGKTRKSPKNRKTEKK